MKLGHYKIVYNVIWHGWSTNVYALEFKEFGISPTEPMTIPKDKIKLSESIPCLFMECFRPKYLCRCVFYHIIYVIDERVTLNGKTMLIGQLLPLFAYLF